MAKFTLKWIDGPSFTVAVAAFGSDLMGTIFSFYYVKIFLNVYHIDDKWMNIAQVLFLVWNAINDPLFGYIQDFGLGSCCKWITIRRKVMLYCGPVYAVVFMIPWIPWSYGSPDWLVGLHLITSLFFYDAFLSLVMSAFCGMFTEVSTKHGARVRIVVYIELASLLASFVIFPVDKLSESLENLRNFQICSAVVAALAMMCFMFTGLKAPKQIAQIEEMKAKKDSTSTQPQKNSCSPPGHKTLNESVREGLQSCKQLFLNRDFWCVVLANFFHIMRSTGDANFLAIYTEALVSPNYSTLAKGATLLSLYYTACNAVPKLFLALCWPLLNKFGAWTLVMGTFALTIVNCMTIFFVGRINYTALAIFFFVEFILCRSLWPAVYNIFFPDVIDEDMKQHKRTHPISVMVFTLNALLTKPAISVAPIIIIKFLQSSNYSVYTTWTQNRRDYPGNATYTEYPPSAMPEAQLDTLFDNMFLVGCFFPLVCAALEAMCLVPYRLKFRYRRDVVDIVKEEVKVTNL